MIAPSLRGAYPLMANVNDLQNRKNASPNRSNSGSTPDSPAMNDAIEVGILPQYTLIIEREDMELALSKCSSGKIKKVELDVLQPD